jgi:two-component system CheB/CheR fusion protein
MNTSPKKNRKHSRPGLAAASHPKMTLPEASAFPIIGIGASAGGLDALELFFSRVPVGCNLAFVVIQHLDPTYKSIMSSLLKKYTAMKIAEISDGMTIEKNCVYLGPPGHNIAIINATLHYVEPEKIHSGNLPIDFFFRSLAEDQAARSIAVILSGTGTDGTLGIREIKGAGGMAMAQDPAQARYSGMPKSAVDTGMVDFVLPAEKMPGQIIKYGRHPYLKGAKTEKINNGDFPITLQKILLLIRKTTGHDFSLYKHNTIRRGIERRMALHLLERTDTYLHYLEKNSKEVELLFKELLINVTRFFRDPGAFSALGKTGLTAILDRKDADTPIRIWVPGCSTGEEAYSLAMLLSEAMEEHKKHFAIQIFASDMDADAIEIGRNAVYPESISADVSMDRLERFFTKDGASYRVKKQLRECVVFAVHDIAKDPPFSRLDLISCRNMLIYMDHELQQKIIPIFHYALADNGILFLGTSESIGDMVSSFSPIDTKWKIYRKKGVSVRRAEYPIFPSRPQAAMQPGRESAPLRMGFRSLGEKVLAANFAPPSVLVNENFDILYSYGNIDPFLAISTGEPSLNILRIAREGLCHQLGSALLQAKKDDRMVIRENVRIKGDGHSRIIDLTVQPVVEPGETQKLMMVVFRENPVIEKTGRKTARPGKPAVESDELGIIQKELNETREYLQNTIETLQTTNEEFQSTNEELQSTNEELETSKEEIQSTNEELVMVNSELQHKVDQLMEAGNDVSNLLASTEIASIFLDMELRIKRFTPASTKIFRLLNTDLGRPIRDITSSIPSFDICAAADSVLATLDRKEAEVQSDDGRWYRLRIIPYRTMENTIEGVVITFIDITDLKRAFQATEEAKLLADGIVDTIHDPFVILDADLNVRSVNTPFCTFFKVKPDETVNRRIYELGNGQWKIPRLQDLLSTIVAGNTKVTDYVVTHDFPGIGRKTISLNARRIANNKYLLLSMIDSAKGAAPPARRKREGT